MRSQLFPEKGEIVLVNVNEHILVIVRLIINK
jgi:hypothetical protein